nr:cytochrome c [Pelomonas sp. P8]
MIAFGIAYISWADIDSPSAWGDGRGSGELVGAKNATAGGAAHAKVDGGALFASMCVACHQASGQGLPGVFPPLAGSEWVRGKDTTVAAILLHGINGQLTVKGNVYNGAMPSFGEQLSDEQIAAVLSYIRSQWGNAASPITTETVAVAREANKARTGAFAGDKELPPHD